VSHIVQVSLYASEPLCFVIIWIIEIILNIGNPIGLLTLL